MKYFNLKILAQNPESYEEKIKELEKYPKSNLFLAIEDCKRQKYSESMIMQKLTEDGYGEVEADIAIEEYHKFTINSENYKLHI
jgi:hypothetical protein